MNGAFWSIVSTWKGNQNSINFLFFKGKFESHNNCHSYILFKFRRKLSKANKPSKYTNYRSWAKFRKKIAMHISANRRISHGHFFYCLSNLTLFRCPHTHLFINFDFYKNLFFLNLQFPYCWSSTKIIPSRISLCYSIRTSVGSFFCKNQKVCHVEQKKRRNMKI